MRGGGWKQVGDEVLSSELAKGRICFQNSESQNLRIDQRSAGSADPPKRKPVSESGPDFSNYLGALKNTMQNNCRR